MKQIMMGLCALIGLAGCSLPSSQDNSFTLGSVQDVTNWFSYPNNCSVICYKDWTLEQTAEHYLQQSLTRDGYSGTVEVTILNSRQVIATYLNSDIPDTYKLNVSSFLQTGTLAYQGAQSLNAQDKWSYDWYFFLPQGMALRNHKTLEFLHFPPDYSLTKVQDYLISNTTDRWNTMLEINGVPTNQTPLYQTVLDLAPIAAPASAGSTLKETYPAFKDYTMTMLQNWTLNADSQILPVVAFGGPVRDWINSEFKVSLDVNDVAYIKLPNHRNVPFMGANHPSYIWYAGNVQGGDDTPEKAYERGTKVMLQDAIASCWQSKMGASPNQNAHDVASICTTEWTSQPKKICEMYYEQVQYKTDQQAAELCKDVTRIPSKPDLKAPTIALDRHLSARSF